MKKLVVYYSRSENTKKIGEEIAKKLRCDVDEIKCDYRGKIGWIKGIIHTIIKKKPEIKHSKNPRDYDLIIIGSPVWAGTFAPPIRTYLNKNIIKKLAFFCTAGDKQTRAIKELKRKPVAFFEVKAKNIKKGNYKKRLDYFCEMLN